MKIKILTDTSCGISRDEAMKLGYELIALPFIMDDNEYDEDNITKKDFYDKLRVCKNIHTSQASLEVVAKKFDELLKENDHILYFPITSGLSGSYASANVLLSDEKYKGKITCIDHRTISVLHRSMLEDVTRLIGKGLEPNKIKELVEANSKNNSIYICVNNLEYLKKGGRVSPLVATIGNLLNIKPILFSDGGSFDVVKKVRSIKLAEESIEELIKNDLKEKFHETNYDKFAVGAAYTECVDEAYRFKEDIEKNFGVKVTMDELPLVVGCHVGPGVVASALYKRVNEY